MRASALAAAVAALMMFGVGVKAEAKTLVYCSEGSPENFNMMINTTGTTSDANLPIYNKLIEFKSDEVEQIGDALARQYQFRVTGHRLIFTGICADCRAPTRPTRKLDLV